MIVFSGHFGTEFVLSFPEGYGNITKLQINIVSMDNATVQLTSPITGVNQSFIVDPAVGRTVNVPTSLVQTTLVKENKYVMVTSDNDISVTVVEYIPGHSSDGYLAIPTNTFGDSYVSMSNDNSIISLVAGNDNTDISIDVTRGTSLISNGGSVKSTSLTLSKLQAYEVKCGRWCAVKILSSAPFSLLFGSYEETSFTSYTTSFIEQITPLPNPPSTLTFIVPMLSVSTEKVVFCSGQSNISITSDDETYIIGYYAFILEFQTSKYIITNQSAICIYEGHGFSTIIPPVTSYTNFYRFLTPSVTTFTHHAAIMVLTSYKDGIRVDQTLPTIAKQETVIVKSTSYSVLYFNITSGQHDITHVDPSVSFGVILYGFGVSGTGSYAYPGGFKFT